LSQVGFLMVSAVVARAGLCEASGGPQEKNGEMTGNIILRQIGEDRY
jgi:hypothetical protein